MAKSKPITLKIDVTKIDKNLLFKGKKGTYLDVVLFENTKPSEYGDTHFCVQSVSKEDRDRGIKGPIIGNATVPTHEQPEERRPSQPPARQSDEPEDGIPF